MLFLLEKDKINNYDFELNMVKNLIDKSHKVHEYILINLNDFFKYDEPDNDIDFMDSFTKKILKDKSEFPKEYQSAVPVGTIQFVSSWLKIFYNIEKENPIEIPPVLRIDEFLKRKYSIVTSEDIPRQGRYFIKDASELKVFSYSGDMEFLYLDELFKEKQQVFDTSLKLDPTHLYQVSEMVDILSEYRVYVIGDRVENIANYDGDPLLFPDANLIKKAVAIYSAQPDSPKSYSLDVMVTKRGTAIIEIHNYTSLGHYATLFGDNLLYAYKDGIDYLLKYNNKPTTFSNF